MKGPAGLAAGLAGLRLRGQPVAQLGSTLADLNQQVCAKLTTFARSAERKAAGRGRAVAARGRV